MNIAILADIHANSLALDAVYKDLELSKCEAILVLGDLVGYYYSPCYVVDKIKNDSRCVVIKGNHEKLLLRAITDKNFADRCHQKYGSGLNVAMKTLSNDQLDWIKELPESKAVEIGGLKLGLYHGSERHIDEYIYPDVFEKRLGRIAPESDFLFFGHTHYPVVFPRNDCVIVNPGSVGQPRDIGSVASYVILNTENLSIVNKRLPFANKRLIEKAKELDPHYPYLSEILERNNSYAECYNEV